VPLTPRARRVLDEICPDEGLIFRRFEYRRILVQAARKVLGTEHEARHLSAHDFRHAALTHMAAVGSDLTAIGHVAGHKTGQKWQIGFEASCEAASVARNSRSALLCVSKHRSQRDRIVRRIGSEVPFLVGHPGLEPGANGLRTHLMNAKTPVFPTIPRVA
jgi:hypothetical protein